MKNWTSLKNKHVKLCFANFSLQYSKFSALSKQSLSSDTNRPNRKTSVLLSLLLWRYWLAVEVGDKCVTKLSSFWCEDRLLCSHSCFFSLSLLHSLHLSVSSSVPCFLSIFTYSSSHLSVHRSPSSAIYCVFRRSLWLFSIICRLYARGLIVVHWITVPKI